MGLLAKALSFALPGVRAKYPMPWGVHVEDRYGVWIKDANNNFIIRIHGRIQDAEVLARFIVDACADKRTP